MARKAETIAVRRCVLVSAENVVLSAILWGEAGDPPGGDDGTQWVQSDTAQPGMILTADGSFEDPPAPSPVVPDSVTNFQARAVMRQTFLPDGRSLFTAVNDDLSAARAVLASKPDSDPAKIKAEIAWQAWEQANDYMRNGPLVMSLASQYGFDAASTDALFIQAAQVIA